MRRDRSSAPTAMSVPAAAGATIHPPTALNGAAAPTIPAAPSSTSDRSPLPRSPVPGAGTLLADISYGICSVPQTGDDTRWRHARGTGTRGVDSGATSPMPLRHITAHHHQSPPYHYGTIAVARVDGTRTSIERRTVTLPSTASEPAGSGSGQPDLTVTITRHDTLATVAPLWREFQERALGHPFQRYEFVSAWLEHVGAGSVAPCICVAETAPGDTVLLLPLGVESGRFTRRLVWLAQDVSDYTAPLIEAGFAERLDQTALMTLWPNVLALAPPVDYLHLAKQVETIGDAANPFFALNRSEEHTSELQSRENL